MNDFTTTLKFSPSFIQSGDADWLRRKKKGDNVLLLGSISDPKLEEIVNRYSLTFILNDARVLPEDDMKQFEVAKVEYDLKVKLLTAEDAKRRERFKEDKDKYEKKQKEYLNNKLEIEAWRSLGIARAFYDEGEVAEANGKKGDAFRNLGIARARYAEIIKTFPGTKAAADARSLLAGTSVAPPCPDSWSCADSSDKTSGIAAPRSADQTSVGASEVTAQETSSPIASRQSPRRPPRLRRNLKDRVMLVPMALLRNLATEQRRRPDLVSTSCRGKPSPSRGAGPSSIATPREFRCSMTSDRVDSVTKHKSAEPGVACTAFGSNSLPCSSRLICCEPNIRPDWLPGRPAKGRGRRRPLCQSVHRRGGMC